MDKSGECREGNLQPLQGRAEVEEEEETVASIRFYLFILFLLL